MKKIKAIEFGTENEKESMILISIGIDVENTLPDRIFVKQRKAEIELDIGDVQLLTTNLFDLYLHLFGTKASTILVKSMLSSLSDYTATKFNLSRKVLDDEDAMKQIFKAINAEYESKDMQLNEVNTAYLSEEDI